MSTRLIHVTIGADPPARLDKALARDVPEQAHLSRSRISRLIADGCVRRNGEVARDAKARVAEGALFEITVEVHEQTRIAPEPIPLCVVYEDEDLIVIDKPAGLVVHPAPGTPSGTLVNALLHHCGAALSGVGGEKRPGIVHRIDKDTSGLLVATKSDRAHHGLAAQFADHSVTRCYKALAFGAPGGGDPRLRGLRGVKIEQTGWIRITTGLARHRTDRQKQAVVFDAGRHALTRLRVVETYGAPASAAMVECRLETGRTHQIRAHMAYIGHGLIGDPVYGGRRRIAVQAVGEEAAEAIAAFPRQALHAATLGFAHPVSGTQMAFASPLPKDMENLLAALESNP